MAMVPAEGGLLPGGSDRHYTRIPTVLFLLMAPLMGALYVVFLPVAGFALVAGHALRALKTLAMDTFMQIAVAVSPSWAPGEAYLANRKRAKAERAAKRQRDKTRPRIPGAPPSRGLGATARHADGASSGGAGGRIPDGGPGSRARAARLLVSVPLAAVQASRRRCSRRISRRRAASRKRRFSTAVTGFTGAPTTGFPSSSIATNVR